jgi:hypothetical protein
MLGRKPEYCAKMQGLTSYLGWWQNRAFLAREVPPFQLLVILDCG